MVKIRSSLRLRASAVNLSEYRPDPIDSSLPPRVLFRGRNALLHHQPGFRPQHGYVLLYVYVYRRAAGAEQFFLDLHSDSTPGPLK